MLSYDVVFVILCLADFLVQYPRVSYERTDSQTDRHTVTTYAALA